MSTTFFVRTSVQMDRRKNGFFIKNRKNPEGWITEKPFTQSLARKIFLKNWKKDAWTTEKPFKRSLAGKISVLLQKMEKSRRLDNRAEAVHTEGSCETGHSSGSAVSQGG